MRKTVAVLSILACVGGVGLATAQNLDVIKQRQQLMKENGGAAGAAAKMLKGQAPFDLATAQASLDTFVKVAKAMPSLFPEDSKTGGDTKALPAVWTDMADVKARFDKFGEDAAKAKAAITDEASFKASFPPIFKDCGGCHEKYRAPEK